MVAQTKNVEHLAGSEKPTERTLDWSVKTHSRTAGAEVVRRTLDWGKHELAAIESAAGEAFDSWEESLKKRQ